MFSLLADRLGTIVGMHKIRGDYDSYIVVIDHILAQKCHFVNTTNKQLFSTATFFSLFAAEIAKVIDLEIKLVMTVGNTNTFINGF